MAQAARLSLRMQKELKLLLTDPPPGTSFPSLSSNPDISSLSTIDAQIEGPEGTVYSKGVFHIKIQIPERYPFQPPNVTFATPIYHPNIDNGGRICLDILNLPPKGAWQPSLNISTVMTSIGLLLSEPNPDDALMCEISREYKYNRCIFDQKARAMTEKYAKAGACGRSWENQSIQTNAEISTLVDDKLSDREPNNVVSNSKQCGISRKLSLAPSRSTHNKGIDRNANEQPDFTNVGEKIEREKLSHVSNSHNLSCEKFGGSDTSRNLFLESSVQFHKRVDRDPTHSHLHYDEVSLSVDSKELLLHKEGNACQVHLRQGCELAFDNKIITSNKPFQVGQKMLQDSADACQMSECSNETVVKLPAVLASKYQSNSSPGTFAVCLSANHYQQQNSQYSLDALPHGAADKKTGPVRKSLSLGFRDLPQGQREDEKENVLPINKLPHSYPTSQMKSEIIRNQSLDPLNQMQDSNEDNEKLPVHSVKLNEEKTQNQKCSQVQTGILTMGNQQRKEEIPVSESVIIVLDSEDSDEESDGAIRTKLSIARKCKGKRKIQA